MDTDPCIRKLKALADSTRYRIVRELLAAPLTVGELAARLRASQYNVSKHLRILREAGIVAAHKEGKNVHCEVAAAFRQQLSRNQQVLDLGCCSFRFDRSPQ